MNDFATEDFLNKNVRVRPISGVTKGADGGHEETKTNMGGGDYGIKYPGGGAGDDETNDEEKFNKMTNLEMEE